MVTPFSGGYCAVGSADAVGWVPPGAAVLELLVEAIVHANNVAAAIEAVTEVPIAAR